MEFLTNYLLITNDTMITVLGSVAEKAKLKDRLCLAVCPVADKCTKIYNSDGVYAGETPKEDGAACLNKTPEELTALLS